MTRGAAAENSGLGKYERSMLADPPCDHVEVGESHQARDSPRLVLHPPETGYTAALSGEEGRFRSVHGLCSSIEKWTLEEHDEEYDIDELVAERWHCASEGAERKLPSSSDDSSCASPTSGALHSHCAHPGSPNNSGQSIVSPSFASHDPYSNATHFSPFAAQQYSAIAIPYSSFRSRDARSGQRHVSTELLAGFQRSGQRLNDIHALLAECVAQNETDGAATPQGGNLHPVAGDHHTEAIYPRVASVDPARPFTLPSRSEGGHVEHFPCIKEGRHFAGNSSECISPTYQISTIGDMHLEVDGHTASQGMSSMPQEVAYLACNYGNAKSPRSTTEAGKHTMSVFPLAPEASVSECQEYQHGLPVPHIAVQHPRTPSHPPDPERPGKLALPCREGFLRPPHLHSITAPGIGSSDILIVPSPEVDNASSTSSKCEGWCPNGPTEDQRYNIIATIGRGVTAVVKLAHDSLRGHSVAIKMVYYEVPRSKFMRLRRATTRPPKEDAEREVRLLKDCIHPHIVSLYDVYDDVEGRKLCLVLEYAENGPIGTISLGSPCAYTPLPLARLKKYAMQLFDAIDFLHSRMIIHHDIKPENVLLSKEDSVLLSDFGSAEQANKGCQIERNFVGTPTFMAPELLDLDTKNSTVDGRAVDMWAAGVTLIALLTGNLPFRSTQDIRCFNDDYVFPENSPKEWVAFLSLILRRDPKKRLTAAGAKREIGKICRKDSDSLVTSKSELYNTTLPSICRNCGPQIPGHDEKLPSNHGVLTFDVVPPRSSRPRLPSM